MPSLAAIHLAEQIDNDKRPLPLRQKIAPVVRVTVGANARLAARFADEARALLADQPAAAAYWIGVFPLNQSCAASNLCNATRVVVAMEVEEALGVMAGAEAAH